MNYAALARRVAPVVVVAAVIGAVALSGVDLSESMHHIKGANAWWLAGAVVAVMIMRFCRAWRWAGLFPLAGQSPPPHGKQFQIVLAADFINIFTPRAVTMAGRGLLASRVYGIALSAIAVTLFFELLIDTAVVLLLVAALAPYVVFPEHPELAAIAIIVPVVAVAGVGRIGPATISLIGRLLRQVQAPSRSPALARTDAHLRPHGPIDSLLTRAVIATFAVQACRIGVFVAVANAIGGLPLLPVIAATVIATPSQLVPFTIGGAGIREGLLILVLANFAVAPELGVALGLTVLLVSSASAVVGAVVVPRLLLTNGRRPVPSGALERGRAT